MAHRGRVSYGQHPHSLPYLKARSVAHEIHDMDPAINQLHARKKEQRTKEPAGGQRDRRRHELGTSPQDAKRCISLAATTRWTGVAAGVVITVPAC